jgi:shikimate kinase
LLADQQLAGARLIYLRAEASTLRTRLAATNLAMRPSLTGADPLIEIEVVLARRDPLYLEIADEVVQVDGMSEDAALAKLIEIAGD